MVKLKIYAPQIFCIDTRLGLNPGSAGIGMVGNGVVGLSPKQVIPDSPNPSTEFELLSDGPVEFVSMLDQSTDPEAPVDELSVSDVSIAEVNGLIREYTRIIPN